MGTAGIVAEFNPFHSGHARLIESLREHGADRIAVAMSGNFVQRGEAAVLSKWARAKQALLCGVDLVVEIPLPWAVSGAEKFSAGGVSVLSALGVDTLGFGSECGSTEKLKKAADALASPRLRPALREELKTGKTFAAARQRAAEKLFGAETAALLQSPNNILGIEYLKAIKRLGSPMRPFTVRRQREEGSGLGRCGPSVSSLKIRKRMESGLSLEGLMPASARKVLKEEESRKKAPADLSFSERGILARLRTMDRQEFSSLPDISEGLGNRIYEASRKAGTLGELYRLSKTKRYPLARIRRIILSAYLGLQSSDSSGNVPYLRVLGIGPGGPDILKSAKRSGILPIVTRWSDFSALGGSARRISLLEDRAADLYALCLPRCGPCGTDRTEGIVTLFRSS